MRRVCPEIWREFSPHTQYFSSNHISKLQEPQYSWALNSQTTRGKMRISVFTGRRIEKPHQSTVDEPYGK